MDPCQPVKHPHEMCRGEGGGGGGGPEFRVLHNSSWLPASAAGVGRAMEGGREAGASDAKSGLDLSPQILGSMLRLGGKKRLKKFCQKCSHRNPDCESPFRSDKW